MVTPLGDNSLAALIEATVPAEVQLQQGLDLPTGLDEAAAIARLRSMASQNHMPTP